MRVGQSNYEKHPALSLLWRAIGRDLNESIQFVPEEQWRLRGSFLEALSTGSVDVLDDLWLWEADTDDANFTTFSLPAYRTPHMLVINDSGRVEYTETDGWFSPRRMLTTVFAPSMWASVGVCFLLLVLVSGRLTKTVDIHGQIGRRKHSNWWWLFEHYWLQNTHNTAPKAATVTARLVLMVTSALVIHSLVLYQGSLLSSLLQTQPKQVEYTNAQLVAMIAEGRAKLDLFNPDTSNYRLIFERDGWPDMRRALAINPPLFSLVPNQTNTDDTPVVVTITGRLFFIAQLTADKHCRLQFLEFIPFNSHMAAMRFPLSPQLSTERVRSFNAAIRKNIFVIEALLARVDRRVIERHDRCRRQNFLQQADRPGDPIALIRLSIVFLFFVIGILCGIVLFAWEALRK